MTRRNEKDNTEKSLDDAPGRTRAHCVLLLFGVFAMLLAPAAIIFGEAPE
ncbi:MAG: hypothetical protein KJO31_10545 [Gammaproteobacteria bacterium]|nr:hypothetical protein [Gammaproteobacteria bacterium]